MHLPEASMTCRRSHTCKWQGWGPDLSRSGDRGTVFLLHKPVFWDLGPRENLVSHVQWFAGPPHEDVTWALPLSCCPSGRYSLVHTMQKCMTQSGSCGPSAKLSTALCDEQPHPHPTLLCLHKDLGAQAQLSLQPVGQ